MSAIPVLRVARATDNIDALMPFYRDGLGMSVLSSFTDHDGFDGVMLGWAYSPWHLEFTWHRHHPARRAPSQDNLIVFYVPDLTEWDATVARMRAAGFHPVPATNPYWDRHGVTFEDADGYCIVLQNTAA